MCATNESTFLCTRPISISRSNPASFAPAVLPPTDYLQLPAPVSTSSGSQQLRLCDQGVCKPDTAVKKVELLANVSTWPKESTCMMVSSFEQVRAAPLRATHSGPECISVYTPDPLSLLLRISAPICTFCHSRPQPPSQLSGAERQRQRDRFALAEAPALRNATRQVCGG